jgi:signal transduction histidine kinase
MSVLRNVRNLPRCVVVILTYVLVLTLTSLLVLRLGLRDSFLFLFLVPCILSAFFFGRRLYLSMHILTIAAAVWVTSQVSSNFRASLTSIVVVAVSSLALTEAVRAIVTSRERMEEALQRRTAQLEALQEVALEIAAQLDLDTLLRSIVSQAIELVEGVEGGLYVYRPDRDVLEWAVAVGPHMAPLGTILRRGEGLSGKVWETGEPLAVDDYRHWQGRASVFEGYPFTSIVGAPVRWGDEFLGVLNVNGGPTCAFSPADADLLSLFATQAAIAIRNARLYEETQRRALEQKVLREGMMALTTTLDRDEVIDRILAQLQEVVPYDTASVQLLQDGYLEIVGGRGFPNLEELLGVAFDPTREDNPNREVVRTRAPFIVDDAPTLYEEFSREPHAAAGIRSWLGAPMLIGERLIGMIALDKCESGFYTQEHARMAEAFAAQAAIAVENSRLFRAEQEQRKLAETLAEVTLALTSQTSHEAVLDEILRQAQRIVSHSAANIALLDEDTLRVARWRGYEAFGSGVDISNLLQALDDLPLDVGVIQSREPLVVVDTRQEPRWVAFDESAWIRSYLAVPICLHDRVLGLLRLDSETSGQFSAEDARRLQPLASAAAIAIENAQLYRRLLDHAERLEQRVRERTAELRDQYARLGAILRSTADGIVVADEEGEIVQANPVAQTWLTRALSPREAERLQEAVRRVAVGTEEQPVELLELTGLDLELSGAPISGVVDAKEVVQPIQSEPHAVVAVHDVTHLKALDRMKTRFVTNISHELRTPVTTIKLYAHLMRQQPEKWDHYLDVLVQEANHQAQLVEDILQISRIDAGRVGMAPRPVSLSELTEAAVANRRVLAWDRGLALEHCPVDPDPVVLVDPDRMMQVLNNLLENAIRYTPEGGRVVVSTGTRVADGRMWATATVEDTGIGIPEAELSHIFERFFRGVKPRSMQVSGTGLGLAIVREIVELHGGRVSVESREGVGSKFTTWLPLAP